MAYQPHTNLIPSNAGNETQFLSQHYQQADELVDRNSIGRKLILSLYQLSDSMVKEIFKYLPQFLLWLKPEVSLRLIL